MELSWQTKAWEDYLYWQAIDKRMVKRINDLIKDCLCNPFVGIGKPEPLQGNYAGFWSKRIDGEHRLVYAAMDNKIFILQCRYYY